MCTITKIDPNESRVDRSPRYPNIDDCTSGLVIQNIVVGGDGIVRRKKNARQGTYLRGLLQATPFAESPRKSKPGEGAKRVRMAAVHKGLRQETMQIPKRSLET